MLAAIVTITALAAQDSNAPKPATGRITGTVTDVNDDTISGATVVLRGSAAGDPRTVLSNYDGFFEFTDLEPDTYGVTVSAKGFATWTSPPVTVNQAQYVILTGSKLKVAEVMTTVSVDYSPEEVALEQVKIEEQQRVLGIFPNFYVVYDQDAAPLTTKLKFHLAFKTSFDPVTIIAAAAFAGINQAADTPDYPQGLKGYGERYGAVATDGLTDIMIGGAILPSLLHQDPRYFFQGTGTNKSRALHAISNPFICRGDDGHLQPNFSSIGGDLASAAISNAYYPPSNRGAGLMFQNFLISTGERMVSSLAQEFILHRLSKTKAEK
jgi:Carboxypeptidase regulatory-like domain